MVKITTPASYLMGAFISIVLPRMWYCFWFNIFLSIGSSSGFHVAITSTGQKVNMDILAAVEYMCYKYTFQTWGNNQRTGCNSTLFLQVSLEKAQRKINSIHF